MNSWLIGKVPDAGKDWGQKKRVSQDETAGWHYQCNGHELGHILGDGEGQRGLACWSPWCCKESDTTGWLNNNNALTELTYSKKFVLCISWNFQYRLLFYLQIGTIFNFILSIQSVYLSFSFICLFCLMMMTRTFSVLAWRIPGTGEPGGLPSMGSHKVRHDWCDLAAAAAGL